MNPTPHPIILEVCVGSVAGAAAAAAGGADRIELNAALAVGGLTPTIGLLRQVRQTVGSAMPIICMVRPRPGDFAYDHAEQCVMERDIELALEHGADGVAIGLLTADAKVDIAGCRCMRRRIDRASGASGAKVQMVFHRAFDFAADVEQSLETLVDLGFDRILTSGQAKSAPAGAAVIARLIEQAEGRIEILPGAGIRPQNVLTLLDQTKANQVHGSFRPPAAAPSAYESAGLGAPDAVSLDAVRAVRNAIDRDRRGSAIKP